MSILDLPIGRLDGTQDTVGGILDGRAALVVNVASRCGLTPQYAQLAELQQTYGERGFTVLGVPCNQFNGQEPGSPEEIAAFCSTTYGVDFPLTEKVEVNGDGQHPLYAALVDTPDDGGHTGDIRWNFEKFVLDRTGAVVARFEPGAEPDQPAVVAAVEGVLSPR